MKKTNLWLLMAGICILMYSCYGQDLAPDPVEEEQTHAHLTCSQDPGTDDEGPISGYYAGGRCHYCYKEGGNNCEWCMTHICRECTRPVKYCTCCARCNAWNCTCREGWVAEDPNPKGNGGDEGHWGGSQDEFCTHPDCDVPYCYGECQIPVKVRIFFRNNSTCDMTLDAWFYKGYETKGLSVAGDAETDAPANSSVVKDIYVLPGIYTAFFAGGSGEGTFVYGFQVTADLDGYFELYHDGTDVYLMGDGYQI